jgi:ABC-type glutathione transport system ATPase component
MKEFHSSNQNPLLSLANATVTIHTDDGVKTVLKNFSLEVQRGEILALVGESGSGKVSARKPLWGYYLNPPPI